MVDFQCDICHELFPLESFLFSFCGHGFCESCTESLKGTRKCPSCRSSRKVSQLHKIFVTPPEIDGQSHMQSLASSMDQLRPDSSPSVANDTVNSMRKFIEKVQIDAQTEKYLLDVAKNMEDRLLPIFFRLQLEQDEKRALQEKVNLWHPMLVKAKSSVKEVERLQEELEKALAAKEKTACENRALTKLLEAEMKESEKLRRDVIDERRLVKEKDVLVKQLEQEKENADKQVKLAKRKLRVLTKDTSLKQKAMNAETHSQSADDSLIVEPAASGLSLSVCL